MYVNCSSAKQLRVSIVIMEMKDVPVYFHHGDGNLLERSNANNNVASQDGCHHQGESKQCTSHGG